MKIVNKIEIKNEDDIIAIIVHYDKDEAINVACPNPITINDLASMFKALASRLEKDHFYAKSE